MNKDLIIPIVMVIIGLLFITYVIIDGKPVRDCMTICEDNNLTFYKYYPDKQICACNIPYVVTFKMIDIDELGK